LEKRVFSPNPYATMCADKDPQAHASQDATGDEKTGDEAVRARADTKSFMNSMQFFRREFNIDIQATYDRLKTVGKLDKKDLRDRMLLSEAINEASECSVLATRIYLKARKERELFRIEFNRRKRDLTKRATQQIEWWMEAHNVKKKQITKDMVEEEIASNDSMRKELTALVEEQERYREIVGNLKVLAEEWSNRKGTLQTQARLLTSQREVVLGGGS